MISCDLVQQSLGVVMARHDRRQDKCPSVFDAVALLASRVDERLSRGQVGTVVEPLDEDTVLVEFSDDDGKPYAVVPCRKTELLVLHYVPEVA